MTRAGPRRAGNTFLRGLFFTIALSAIPGGLYGVIAQHAFGAAVAALLGVGSLGVWWLTSPRYAGARARRLGQVCSLLTIVVAAAAEAGLVLFLASPAYGVTLGALMPAIILGAAALLLLSVRALAGRRLRALAAADAGPVPGSLAAVPGMPAAASIPSAGSSWRAARSAAGAGTGPIPDYRLATQGEEEISELQQQWRRGERPPSSPCLAVQPDGAVVLRPARGRVTGWHRGSAAILPFALIMVGRVFFSSGWAGLIVVAAGVAAVLLPLLGLYELRLRRGVATLTASEVIVPAWYGRRRSVHRRLVTRVVLAWAEMGSAQPTVVARMLLISDDRRCLRRLNVAGVPAADLKAFAAALQVPVDILANQMRPEDLQREFPGSVSWAMRHQVLLGILIAVAIVVIVVGVVVALAVAGVIKQSG